MRISCTAKNDDLRGSLTAEILDEVLDDGLEVRVRDFGSFGDHVVDFGTPLALGQPVADDRVEAMTIGAGLLDEFFAGAVRELDGFGFPGDERQEERGEAEDQAQGGHAVFILLYSAANANKTLPRAPKPRSQ